MLIKNGLYSFRSQFRGDRGLKLDKGVVKITYRIHIQVQIKRIGLSCRYGHKNIITETAIGGIIINDTPYMVVLSIYLNGFSHNRCMPKVRLSFGRRQDNTIRMPVEIPGITFDKIIMEHAEPLLIHMYRCL